MSPDLPGAARAVARLSLAGVAACGALASPDRLTVVHDAGGAVPAAPYLERPALSAETRLRALDRARERLAERAAPGAAPAFRPAEPGPLRAGRAAAIRVRGLSRPVFAVGSDAASLKWLASNGARLRDAGARGFVVGAASAEALSRVRAVAARFGLRLDPVSGAALADAYGARSYPFVAEPSP